MTRTDAVVLGAGIVGTSVALHLVKRGLSVALVAGAAPARRRPMAMLVLLRGPRSIHTRSRKDFLNLRA